MTLKIMKTALVYVTAIGALAFSACAGGPCQQVCSQFNACDLKQRDHDVECRSFCEDEQSFEARAAAQSADTCATEFNAYIGCFASNNDAVCNAESTACEETLTSYVACVQKYCDVADNHTDPACLEVDDGVFAPSFAGF